MHRSGIWRGLAGETKGEIGCVRLADRWISNAPRQRRIFLLSEPSREDEIRISPGVAQRSQPLPKCHFITGLSFLPVIFALVSV